MLLWFLPLAAIPVVLHLITLLRLRTVEISTFRFLMDGYVRQRRRVRLLEYAVMLLRFAFIVLIVFLLARPVVERFSMLGGGGSRDVTVVVDAGASMGLSSGGTTSMSRAIEAAAGVVNLLDRRDHVRVIAAGSRPEVVTEGFAANPERTAARLRTIAPSLGEADLAAALEQAARAPRRGAAYLFVVTDGLARKWSRLRDHPALDQIDPETEVVVMNVGPTEPVANVGVIGDPPRDRAAMKGLPVLLHARLVNGSTRRDAETVLSVVLDDRTVRQLPVTLAPEGAERVSLHVTPRSAGPVRGRFQLPGDVFPDDDAYRFVINAQPRLSVLIITGPEAQTKGDEAERRSRDPRTYLEAALRSPLLAESGAGERDRRVAAAIEVEDAPFRAVPDAQLSAADVVVLADAPLDAALGERLRRFAASGGGLLVMPGRHVDASRYNAHLLRPHPRLRSAAPGLLLEPPRGDVDDEAAFTGVARVSLSHPVMRGFARDHRDKRYFSGVRVGRRFGMRFADPLEHAEPQASPAPRRFARPEALLEADDGSPLLAEAAIGAGRVVLFAVPATPDWSSLPLGREFVPLMVRAVTHLQRPPDVTVDAAVDPGAPAVVRVTPRWPDATVEVIDPAGKRHAVELHPSDNRQVGAMLATDRAGFYRVEITPHAEGAPPSVAAGFAVNAQRSGAAFATASPRELRDWLTPLDPTYLAGSADDPVLTRRLTERREIWRTLIWVTLGVIGVEFFLATLMPAGSDRRRAGASRDGSGPAAIVRHWIGRVGATLSGKATASSSSVREPRS